MLKLIGHRGLPQRSPENTLLSLGMALDAGADAVECDVQLSAARIPYLFHDATFDRVSSTDGLFFDKSEEQLSAISVHEPSRFGDKYDFIELSYLHDVCTLLEAHENAKIFIELKPESLQYHSRGAFVDAVVNAVAPVRRQVIIISYDISMLEYAREHYQLPIGWVLEEYSSEYQAKANTLKPEFLFCEVNKLDSDSLWVGSWEWAVYDIVSSAQAKALYQRGVAWVESWDVHTLRRGLSIG